MLYYIFTIFVDIQFPNSNGIDENIEFSSLTSTKKKERIE